jgi:cystathionine beta-lyase
MLSDTAGTMRDQALGPVYGLEGGSAARALRSALAELEGAEETFLVPSGLAAVTVPLAALLRPGDEVIATDAVYGPSRRFLSRWLAARGVTTRYHPATADADAIAELIGDATRLILIESPASLTFEMIDVPRLALLARDRGVLTVVDNTWGAGLAYKPLQHGADVSVQAVTKYAAGHSDLLMGSVAVSDPAIARAIQGTIEDMGWHVSPDDAWLALRGLRTLPLRYEEQARSAMKIATWLTARAEIESVLYPPLPEDPAHEIWARDYSGAASVLGLVMNGGDAKAAERLLDALSLFGLGWSWGGFESLATHETGQLAQRVYPPRLTGELIRLHVGLEDPDDLIADLDRALAAWRGD